MRHRMQKNSSFGRHRDPRKALIRGLVKSLVEKERIKTTLTKAKCVRPLIERAVTMGKKGDVNSRRLLLARYPHKETVTKIIGVLSPRFKERAGGYTRIIKLGPRHGDKAPLAYLEFVDYTGSQKTSSSKEIKKTEEAKTDNKENKEVKAGSKRIKKDLVKRDKARKKLRLKQKQSRRINRPN